MKNNLTVEETFALAVKSYQEKKFHVAEKFYKEILKTHPNHSGTYVNLGMALNKLKKVLQKKDVSMANADEVKRNTGFSIGGVAPVAHTINLDVLVDKSLNRFKYIFAAAGHPNCVFKITYNELIKITNGSEKEISE